jgi:hypothetical protein
VGFEARVDVACDGGVDCGEWPNAATASRKQEQIAAMESLVMGPQFYLGV